MNIESMKAAIELHRPVMYDRYAYVTEDPAKMKHRRCSACGYSVGEQGCKTWETANS